MSPADFTRPQVSAVSKTFRQFVNSERTGGVVLIVCTAVSLAIANSAVGPGYLEMWHTEMAGLTMEHWINDALMAVFFLFVGLELERELYNGELSNLRNALLPIVAAIGGLLVPALIHFAVNAGTATQSGMGIPMATDIAFALGVLALLGDRVPASLKVFLVAFAIMDDLGAIIIIAVFYTTQLSVAYLAGAAATWGVLLLLNRWFRVMKLAPYLVGGALMWFLMLKSGVHATLAGVLLAFALPFSACAEDRSSPSHRLENALQKPVAFLILPIFALANTAIIVGADWAQQLISPNSLGIIAGLLLGKPLGVVLACFLAVSMGLCRLPDGLGWRHIWGAGILGGIGFTMSIFITNLAFTGNEEITSAAKVAILCASLLAGTSGYCWLKFARGNDK